MKQIKLMKKILLLCLLFLGSYNTYSQCTVTSSNGYVVHLNVTPVSVVVSSMTCPFGYNFNYSLNYNIGFSGSNIPANLWTLQGNVLAPGYAANFYDLPNAGGVGNVISGGNSPTTNTNCATVQLSDLNPTIRITIQGPGIPYQNIICPITVPIELISFTGKNTLEGNLLEWSTASETNNEYFIIETSVDLINWIDIKKIKGSNNSNSIINYSFIDNQFINEINYYRIKQIDYNTKFTYSNIIVIDNKKEYSEIHVYNLLGQEVDINNDLPPGVYIIRSLKGNQYENYKFIK